jgi:hypothetical protein
MNDNDKYLFLTEEIKEQQLKVDEEVSILKGLERLLSKYSQNENIVHQQDQGKALPKEYSTDLTLPEKLFVALYTIKSGTVHDAVQSLLKLEPSFPPAKALKDARNYLSKLSKKGEIGSKKAKKGRGNIYFIK